MYSFIVLGEIPGTNITISFTMWVLLCLLVITTAFYIRLHRNQAAPQSLQSFEPTIAQE